MNTHRFDTLARIITRTLSRRGLGGALIGFVAGVVGLSEVGAAPCPRGKRRCRKRCISKRACCKTPDCRPKVTGKVCQRGQCRCPAARPKNCHGRCIAANACCVDAECPVGQACTGGTCGCANGYEPCGNGCIPNGDCCGGCAPGQACRAGRCCYATVAALRTALEPGGPDTIHLCADTTYQGSISIGRDVTIIGAGATSTIFSGGGVSVLTVAGAEVEFRDIGITNGQGARGAGLANLGGTATLVDCSITNNQSTSVPREGGGVYNSGTMTLTRCEIAANHSNGHGGGIYNSGTLTLDDSTVSGNEAWYAGGGIYNGTITGTPKVTMRGASLVTDNDADPTSTISGGGINNVVPTGPSPSQPGIVEILDTSQVTNNRPNDCTNVDCSG